MKYELKSLSIGETIGTSINIYFDNFTPLFLISLLTILPSLLQNLLFTGDTGSLNSSFVGFFTFIIMLFVSAIQSGLIIKIVANRYLGKPLDISRIWNETKIIIGGLIGVSILTSLYIAGGLILLVIPGIYFIARYSVAIEVLAIEGCSAGESMKRSKELTGGHIGKILLQLFLISIILIIVLMIAIFLFVFIVSALFGVNNDTSIYITKIVTYFIGALITPIPFCLLVLIYFNLRIEKEGYDVEHLASEFADTEQPEDQI